METGLINQRISIFKDASIIDGFNGGYGGSIPFTDSYWETNAEVKQLKSNRVLEADVERIDPVFRFKIRYRRDKNVTLAHKIWWRQAYLIIVAIYPDVIYREYLTIDAKMYEAEDANIILGTGDTT